MSTVWTFCLAALAAPVLAADVPAPPVTDPYFYASNDPLAQRVLSTQIADQHSGVVSAMLVAPADPKAAPARVAYEGTGTPTEGLAKPNMLRKKQDPGASDLRDAPAAAPSDSRAEARPKRTGQTNRLDRACDAAAAAPSKPAAPPAEPTVPSAATQAR